MPEERIRRCVVEYFSAIGRLDREGWVATFAPHGEMRDPADAPPIRGHDQLRAFFDGVAGLFREIDITPDDIFVCGDTAAVRWSWRGVGKNGRAVSCAGIDLFQIDGEGKIVSQRGYWEPSPFLAQLSA